MEIVTAIPITKRTLKAIAGDASKTASAVDLIYVSDAMPGITRLKKGKGYAYFTGDSRITDEATIFRIRRLVIPPAWERVWICSSENGHLQATGYDTKNRKQYIYHHLWNQLRNHTKYYHLYEFGKIMPRIRQQLQQDLARHGLPSEKVLAAIVSLMQYTCIRIGSNAYEKLYGSFGLTTLKNKHVQISGSELRFSFKGKKGIFHDITLKSKKLANIVKQCRDIPGKELFQYYDEEGTKHSIDSGMVNNYIKEISGGGFTAKDFRTWEGTLHAISAFKELGPSETQTEAKRKINEALDMVAKHLGNTRSVCKKYYVHPAVLDHYTNNTLEKFLHLSFDDASGLHEEEQVLMKILEGAGTAVLAA